MHAHAHTISHKHPHTPHTFTHSLTHTALTALPNTTPCVCAHYLSLPLPPSSLSHAHASMRMIAEVRRRNSALRHSSAHKALRSLEFRRWVLAAGLCRMMMTTRRRRRTAWGRCSPRRAPTALSTARRRTWRAPRVASRAPPTHSQGQGPLLRCGGRLLAGLARRVACS